MSRVCLNQSGATDTIAVVCAAVSRGCSVGSRARDLFTASSAGSNGRFRPLTNITHTKPGRAVCVTACECVCTHLHTYRTAAYHVCALCWSLRVFPLQEATDVRILPPSRVPRAAPPPPAPAPPPRPAPAPRATRAREAGRRRLDLT